MKSLITETRSELLTKIVKTLALKSNEIGEMVELYYDSQHLRIQHANKERTEPPSELAEWLDFWSHAGESVILGALKRWVLSNESPSESKWAYDQVGIGPVIAAGLAAHINVEKAATISNVWKFAGYAPGSDKKVKGQKLAYNSRLKTLCWKLGKSFVMVSGKEGAFYGQLYTEFKAEEIKRNEEGKYAGAAKRELASKRITEKATKERLLSGKLTDGHLDSRARRRAVKVFLAHYWTKGRESRGLPVRDPYPITILGHDGKIASP